MTFERTYNTSIIRQIMTDPCLWNKVNDDFAGPSSDFQPRMDESIWYVLVKEGDEQIMGLFIFYPQNAICWEVHARMLPESWGPVAAQAVKGVFEWFWQNTFAVRLVTSILADNMLALNYAKKAGMTEYGRNPASFQKWGELIDQVLMGISRKAA